MTHIPTVIEVLPLDKHNPEEDEETNCVQHVLVLPASGNRAECERKYPYYVHAKAAREWFNRHGSYNVPKGLADKWVDSVFWSSKARVIPLYSEKPTNLPNFNHTRPLTYRLGPEIFAHAYEDPETDVTIYRSTRTGVFKESLTQHYLQAYSSSCLENCPEEYLTAPVVRRTDAQWRRILKTKTGFVGMAYSRVIKGTHRMDALVRHATCGLINRRRPHGCHSVSKSVHPYRNHTLVERFRRTCGPMHLDVFRCYRPYKFVIAMENESSPGYVSEKIVTAAMADAVPIYFGAPDIFEYVNRRRVIHCDVPMEKLKQLRRLKHSSYSYSDRIPRNRTRISQGQPPKVENQPSDEDLIDFMAKELGSYLDPCIERVFEVDANDRVWIRMVREPLFLTQEHHSPWDRTHFDGNELALAFLSLVRVMKGVKGFRSFHTDPLVERSMEAEHPDW